jgi:hypothetical protein
MVTQQTNPKYRVDEKIKISLNGRIREGVIQAAIESSDGWRYQVGLGDSQTVLVYEWQIVWRVVIAGS